MEAESERLLRQAQRLPRATIILPPCCRPVPMTMCTRIERNKQKPAACVGSFRVPHSWSRQLRGDAPSPRETGAPLAAFKNPNRHLLAHSRWSISAFHTPRQCKEQCDVHVLPQISGNFPRHTDFPVGADVGADFTRRVAQRSAGHPRANRRNAHGSAAGQCPFGLDPRP